MVNGQLKNPCNPLIMIQTINNHVQTKEIKNKKIM